MGACAAGGRICEGFGGERRPTLVTGMQQVVQPRSIADPLLLAQSLAACRAAVALAAPLYHNC
eukprot:1161263-Pelagomonas_calceolata.AAC.11